MLVNRVAAMVFPPRILPKLDSRLPVDDAHRTLVVVPALLSSAAATQAIIENLEIAYLANRDPNVGYALLGDLKASAEPTRPDDGLITEAAAARHLGAQRALRGRARRAPVPPADPRAPPQRVREHLDGLGAQARRAAGARARDARRQRHHLLAEARRRRASGILRRSSSRSTPTRSCRETARASSSRRSRTRSTARAGVRASRA